MTAGELMNRDVRYIKADGRVRDVVAALDTWGHAAYPVVDDQMRLLGMVSQEDLMHLALPQFVEGLDLSFLPASATFIASARYGSDLNEVPVRDIMRTRHVVSVAEDEPVVEVARLMLHHRVSRIPVVRDGKLVGIISRSDIVHEIVRPTLEASGGGSAQSGGPAAPRAAGEG